MIGTMYNIMDICFCNFSADNKFNVILRLAAASMPEHVA